MILALLGVFVELASHGEHSLDGQDFTCPEAEHEGQDFTYRKCPFDKGILLRCARGRVTGTRPVCGALVAGGNMQGI